MIDAITATAAIHAADDSLIAALQTEALLGRLSAKHPEDADLLRQWLEARRQVAAAEHSYDEAIGTARYEKCRHYRLVGEAA
jgi:hypothetical protein